jgi:Tfp pilus assembly protein PilV
MDNMTVGITALASLLRMAQTGQAVERRLAQFAGHRITARSAASKTNPASTSTRDSPTWRDRPPAENHERSGRRSPHTH